MKCLRLLSRVILLSAGACSVAFSQPANLADVLERGRALEQSGKAEDAQRLYEKSAREYPDQPAFHYQLGLLAMQRRAWGKAVTEFQACLRFYPRQADTLLLLAQAYESNRQAELALETARRAAEFHPEHAGACRLYAQHLCQAGKCSAGLGWLMRAKRLSPGLPGIEYDIGLTYFKLNDWTAAQSWLEAALGREQDNVQVRFMLAEVCKRTRDWEKARANYEWVLAAGKRDAATYFGLGTALAALEKYEAAVHALESAYRLEPSMPAELHFMLAKSLRALGRNEEAEREMVLRQRLMDLAASGYRFTTAADSAEQGLWTELAGLLAEAREADALALIKARAPAANPRYLLGAGYFVLGRMPEAASNVRAALARQPKLKDGHAYLAKILLSSGDATAAEIEVRAELGRDPLNVLGLATLGEIRFAQGRWVEAADSLQASHSKHPEVLLKLCESYFRIGRKSDALITADLVRSVVGGDARWNAELGKLLRDWGGG